VDQGEICGVFEHISARRAMPTFTGAAVIQKLFDGLSGAWVAAFALGALGLMSPVDVIATLG